ncbi:glycosyltransferase family 4 protein [Neobacillus sp. 3P2-tot-E-2]|uniref:glycosyltransferase family 4 protein n=1 Tax=Neobacillus sp. 3P2-tot-E-2 TaxID=3132212 RepID=UPI0039A0FD12
MKIVHLCLGCFFPDNYSYQENMLPKFHKELGYDVEVIASLVTFDINGKGTFLEKGSTYQNEYDIKVTRLDYKKPVRIYKKLKRFIGTYTALETAKPDILFIHGCQFIDMDIIVKYLNNNPQVKVFVDNHADFSNSATNWLSKNVLHKILWRHCAQIIKPYTTKFYGVLPARVDFLIDMYRLPKEKVELLVMGADDERVEQAASPQVRQKIRDMYGIAEDDFLIVTGGKIDEFKMQTLLLMEAINQINNSKIKLVVFGSVTNELKEKVHALCDGNIIQYIGWIKAEDSYDYFSTADLVVFPGRHSVFWEQVVGMGIPMVCKYWDGTTHVDVGGNVEFLHKDTVEEIKSKILSILNDKEKYEFMKATAKEKGIEVFSYKKIARRAIEK